MNAKPVILTGHRPTGPCHIGHLVGTLQNWARFQDSYTCFFLIADLHVLTTDYEAAGRIQANTLERLFDWLAAGIDPQRAHLVLQSALPEHAYLSVLLANLVTVARLERNPTYKEQVQQLNLTPSAGLLTYPVLQAADILIYRATHVPVGEDQLPHVELTREVARRFNQLYGDFFSEPEAVLAEQARLPGIDNRTMHTSYGNAIFIKDTPEETTRKVMRMYTDPTRLHATDPGHVEDNPVFTYLDLFDPDRQRLAELKEAYRAGQVGDVEVKRLLAGLLNEALAPMRARRADYAAHPDLVFDLLHEGTAFARLVVKENLAYALRQMGLSAQFKLSF
ncbi:MAG TPA: tryptophan--tRNA ligase [Anaerolineaceae bacterium]|nr:tryptophan--tRNA ligase [Anaerolineaceae bacterium]HPN51425.1 tryptophan--tRNA ligase [Anaerolineaceae bacterium]